MEGTEEKSLSVDETVFFSKRRKLRGISDYFVLRSKGTLSWIFYKH